MVARLKLKEIDGRAPKIHSCGASMVGSGPTRPFNYMDSPNGLTCNLPGRSTDQVGVVRPWMAC